jgi:hypothetical protein
LNAFTSEVAFPTVTGLVFYFNDRFPTGPERSGDSRTKGVKLGAEVVVALLALGRFVGCDTTHTQEQVKHTGEWAQHEVTAAEDYLEYLLPSVGAGAVGTFLGFRRRGKAAAPKPADSQSANPPGPG